MVVALREKGITDERVLAAIGAVPRHLFVESMLDHMAYEDRALPIRCGQTISQPSTVAFQSELLEAERNMKVLEVGTGSGYQTAVLCEMGLKVCTIERQKQLFDVSKPLLAMLGYRVKCFLGDGYKGLPEYGPFDRIIITCGAPTVPSDLIGQLKPGGVMVIPVGGERQEMLRIVKSAEDDGELLQQRYGDFHFVPMIEDMDYGKIQSSSLSEGTE